MNNIQYGLAPRLSRMVCYRQIGAGNLIVLFLLLFLFGEKNKRKFELLGEL